VVLFGKSSKETYRNFTYRPTWSRPLVSSCNCTCTLPAALPCQQHHLALRECLFPRWVLFILCFHKFISCYAQLSSTVVGFLRTLIPIFGAFGVAAYLSSASLTASYLRKVLHTYLLVRTIPYLTRSSRLFAYPLLQLSRATRLISIKVHRLSSAKRAHSKIGPFGLSYYLSIFSLIDQL